MTAKTTKAEVVLLLSNIYGNSYYRVVYCWREGVLMTMAIEPRAMKEIHDIREKIYEDTKHMTPKEQTELTRREAQVLVDKFGLKIKCSDGI